LGIGSAGAEIGCTGGLRRAENREHRGGEQSFLHRLLLRQDACNAACGHIDPTRALLNKMLSVAEHTNLQSNPFQDKQLLMTNEALMRVEESIKTHTMSRSEQPNSRVEAW
jgi:hypothetical protein